MLPKVNKIQTCGPKVLIIKWCCNSSYHKITFLSWLHILLNQKTWVNIFFRLHSASLKSVPSMKRAIPEAAKSLTRQGSESKPFSCSFTFSQQILFIFHAHSNASFLYHSLFCWELYPVLLYTLLSCYTH